MKVMYILCTLCVCVVEDQDAGSVKPPSAVFTVDKSQTQTVWSVFNLTIVCFLDKLRLSPSGVFKRGEGGARVSVPPSRSRKKLPLTHKVWQPQQCGSNTTAAAIDIAFGLKTPRDPWRIGVGAELPSCHSGVDGPLAAAAPVPRGCLARN